MDCLYELLKMFYVNQMAVSNKSSEVQVLVQLLNDTPLSRSVRDFKYFYFFKQWKSFKIEFLLKKDLILISRSKFF